LINVNRKKRIGFALSLGETFGVWREKMYFCKGMDQVHAFMKIHFDYGYRQRFALVSADAGLY